MCVTVTKVAYKPLNGTKSHCNLLTVAWIWIIPMQKWIFLTFWPCDLHNSQAWFIYSFSEEKENFPVFLVFQFKLCFTVCVVSEPCEHPFLFLQFPVFVRAQLNLNLWVGMIFHWTSRGRLHIITIMTIVFRKVHMCLCHCFQWTVWSSRVQSLKKVRMELRISLG